MDTSPFLDHYQTQLTDQLLRLCTNAHALTGQLLSTPDLAERWNDVAAPYLADAVPEIAKYPHVALGWMMYASAFTTKTDCALYENQSIPTISS